MFGQTLSSLILTKPKIQGKKDRGSIIYSRIFQDSNEAHQDLI
jgi:hypothetical protein